MGIEKRTIFLKGLVFALALVMLIPVSISASTDSEKTEMYLVYSDTPGLNVVRSSGASIAKDYGSFLLTSLSQGMKDVLSTSGYQVESINNRLEFSTVAFDTSEEPNLPTELKGSESGYYVVQFIGPIDEAWKSDVIAKGVKLINSVNNNAFIVKMSPSAKNSVEALPFINWIGNYEPAYKLGDGIGTSGTVSVDVRVFNGEDFNTALGQVQGLGASVRFTSLSDIWANKMVIDVDADKIDDIAQLPQVVSIGPWSQERFMNDKAVTVTDADLAWYMDTSGIDVPSNTWGGLTGYGQVVGIMDSGFDTGLATSGHYDWFNGPLGDRVLRVQRSSTITGPTADAGEFGGHGTHVTGCMGGNGWCAEEYYGMNNDDHIYGGNHIFAGTAPESMLSFDACGNPLVDEYVYPDAPLAWGRQLADGAYIHGNSWGGTMNAYSDGQDADNFAWANPNNLVVFSASNSGPSYGTIGDGPTAKNDLTVGASGNDRPSYKFASDPNLIVAFSSRGPEDGRNEPDIMAPGEYLNSLKAVNSQQDPDDADGDGNIYNNPFDPEDCKIDIYPPGGTIAQINWDYTSMSGTSMASPHTSGLAALVRQYFVEKESITPSSVLMKTALLHGTQDMGFGFPSNDQGWGRANVKDSLFPSAPATWDFYDNKAGITTGITWDGTTNGGFNLNVASGRVPFKVTLTWLDYPGTTSSVLLNNMNLVVTSPGGAQTYLGNVFSGAYSVTGGTADTGNNVEKVIIANPATGLWDINVVGASLPNGPIPFAIEVSADFGPQTNYRVEMAPISPVVFSCVAGGSTTFNFNLLNFGSQFDTIALSEINLPTGVTITYTSGTSVGLTSNNDRDISATILVQGTVIPQVYEFTIKGTSTKDPTSPPTQDRIDLKMEVLSMATATRTRVTTSIMSEKSPTIVTYDGATTDTIFIAYMKYDEAGPHIYLRYSTDDMASWTERQAHFLGDGPSEPRMVVLPENSPDHPMRVLIFYAGWDPADETAGSWVRVCMADPPYTTWTNTMIMDNVGGDTTNILRRVAECVIQPGEATEEILVVVESIGGLGGVTQMYQQYSTTGGDTWAYTPITETKVPGQLTTAPNFFPEIGIDQTGNGWCVWYCSDGDRDIHYKRYNAAGAWTDAAYPTVTGLAVVGQQEYEPCIWSSPEGTGNRIYVGTMRSSISPPEAPFATYNVYTDNPTASPPTWHTPIYGSFSTDASQSDYPTGKALIQGNREGTGRNWFTFAEEANIYGTPQVHAATSASGSGFAVWVKYQVTADAIGKDHLTSDSLGNYMYSAFGAAYEPGNTDIWVAKYGYLDYQRQQDPTSVADTTGPLTKNIGVTPNPTSGALNVVLTATIDDSITGFRNIQAARYYSSRDATVRAMTAMDGSFSAVIEGVTASVSVSGWPVGDHTIYVSGQDVVGNWGAYVAYTLTVSANEAPGFGGVTRVQNTGTGTQLNIFWDPADDPNTPITYKLCKWTYSPSSAQITTAFAGAGIYNGIATSYSDTAVVKGTTYYYVARATDSLGASETNEVIKSGTPLVEWWPQTSTSAIPGYQELNLNPMDNPSTVTTASLAAATEYQVGTVEWMSDALTPAKTPEGDWIFNTYGYATGTVNGNLYAKIYRYNGGTPALLFTTGYDDEDIASYTSSHMFTWTHAATPATIPTGDRVYVEYWVHITTPSSDIILTTAGTTAAGGPHDVWFTVVDDSTAPELTTPNTVAEFTDAYYSAASISDDTRAGPTATPPNGDEPFVKCQFATSVDPASVTGITLTFEGRFSIAGTGTMYAWNAAGGTWDTVGATLAFAANVDATMTRSIAANWANYISGGKILWGVFEQGRSTAAVDFLQVQITAPTYFIMQYDNPLAPTSILPSLTNTSTNPPYKIPLTGKLANSWVFVSFPSAMSGAINTILDDDVAGDDWTNWTVAKWYNAQTPLDPWKTYRTGGTANDMPTMTNAMGVWLWITANGGDQSLTLSSYAANSSVAVNVPLYYGWNMVGYPTATSRAESATLPAAADLVASWQAASPYITQHAKGATLMVPGNAYWVHVTVDTTWIVNP